MARDLINQPPTPPILLPGVPDVNWRNQKAITLTENQHRPFGQGSKRVIDTSTVETRDYTFCGKAFAYSSSVRTSSIRPSTLSGPILRSGSNANIQSPTLSNCKPDARDRLVVGVLGDPALIASTASVC